VAYHDWQRGSTGGQTAQHAVRDFLDRHWQSARALGWSDLDLFGCHPDPEFAPVRWDCMGAVTLAAATGIPVTEVHEDVIRYANGTAYRRKDMAGAVPIWMRA